MTEHGEQTQFGDRGAYLVEFLNEVWVDCPKCSTAGLVLTDLPYWKSQPSFTCGSCLLRLAGRQTRWYGPNKGVARRRCGRCGYWLTKTIDGNRVVAKTVLTCPTCQAVSSATISWQTDTSNQPLEPAFGLKLHLQAPCLGRVLWAYNPKHLRFLKGYVSADLREREPNRNSSLASRLPAWMKTSKNRHAVVKSIARIEQLVISR